MLPDDAVPAEIRAVPADASARLVLFVIRRMAVGGLNDALATNALLGSFGLSFRRPLLFLRALMAEMARVSQRQILIGPSCCPRLTAQEGELLLVIANAVNRPALAAARLETLLGLKQCLGALSSAQAVAQAFADLGRPISFQLEDEFDPAFPID